MAAISRPGGISGIVHPTGDIRSGVREVNFGSSSSLERLFGGAIIAFLPTPVGIRGCSRLGGWGEIPLILFLSYRSIIVPKRAIIDRYFYCLEILRVILICRNKFDKFHFNPVIDFIPFY